MELVSTMQLEVPSLQGAYILMAEGKTGWDGDKQKNTRDNFRFWIRFMKEKKSR